MDPDLEQLAQEDALWPWLASDCMADEAEADYTGAGHPYSSPALAGWGCQD